MQNIAFIGTGTCDEAKIQLAHNVRIGLFIGFILIAFILTRLVFLKNNVRTLFKILTFIGLIIIFVVFLFIALIFELDAACGNWGS